MSGSLPEMGDWDSVFDETYLQTYLPMTSEERSREQALAAVALAEVEPGAEILDCPCGFGRHALPLTEAGYVVTAFDRSESQLAEGERRRGDPTGPASSAATIASCRSPTPASTPCSRSSPRSVTSSATRTSASSASFAGCSVPEGRWSSRPRTAAIVGAAP